MQQESMELLWGSSHISGGNAAYVEAMYETYLRDPNAIAPEWRDYFDRLPRVDGTTIDVPHSTIQEHFALLGRQKSRPAPVPHPASAPSTNASRCAWCN
jgi:2-oxoglutarate dehydrogenase E1 component